MQPSADRRRSTAARRSPRGAAPVLAALALAFVAGGCGNDGTGPSDGNSIDRLPRSLTAAEAEVVARSTGFGLGLMARVAESDPRPNPVLSPLSASMALGMTLNGAAGSTFDAMRATLGFDGMSQAEINAAYAGLIELLEGLDPEVEFGIANAVWANEDFPFHASFFDAVDQAFHARVETADFGAPGTLDAINGWVDEETRGFIPRLLQTLDPDLRMVLLNALFFDGSWTEAFDPDDTATGAFLRADGSTVDTELMTRTEVELPYAAGDGWVAAELPYGGGAWALLVVVPAPDRDVRELVAGFEGPAWDALLASLAPTTLDQLTLPKFTVAHDAFLNPVLADMGMGVAFTDAADFTHLSPRGDELCIDFVRQKTFIEVDEAGTRAAAATAVGIGPDSFLGVLATRPFFFALRERLSGALLLTGILGDPSVEDSGPQEGEGMCH